MIPVPGDRDPVDRRVGRFEGCGDEEPFGVVAVVLDVGETLLELVVLIIGVI